MGKGLRTNFSLETSEFTNILEDQQLRFILDFHQKKIFQLTNIVNEETWAQTKVSAKDQDLTNSINSLAPTTTAKPSSADEEEKQANGDSARDAQAVASAGETSDFIISTNSGDDSQSDRKYKVVSSALDFQRIVYEYITLARSFDSLAADCAFKLIELIKKFNSLVCNEILGGEAFNKKKIKHITAKHLGKCQRTIVRLADLDY